MLIRDGKEYRNLQQQVAENTDDIAELKESGITVDAYTKAESDAKFATKTQVANDISALYGDFYTKDQADDRFPTETHMEYLLGGKQDTLTAGAGIDITNNTITVDNTVALKIDLNSKQNTLTTGDGIDITSNVISVDPDYVVTKDSNNNVDGILQVEHLQSEDWDEDDDCKAHVYLTSGERRSTLTLETEGEETGSKIILQGTTSVSSEGIIDLHGETRVFTDGRITVIDSNDDTEDVAYLSDITNYTAGSNVTFTSNGSGGYNINSTVAATIDSLDNYKITINDRYIYRFKDVPNYDITPYSVGALRLIPTYAPIIDKTNHKTGYLEQGNTWVTMYWSDGTNTTVSFTDTFTAVITKN